MRILFLCNKNPYPERDGGCIAMNVNIKEAIRLGYDVKVVAINSKKNFTEIDSLPEDYKKKTAYESVMFDLKVRPLQFLSTYFTGKSPHITRFVSKDFEERLTRILIENEFDIIMLESIFMTPYIKTIRQNSNAKIVLRAHNVEFKIWERLYDSSKFIKKILLKHVYRTLRNYELKVINEVDEILAITSVDADFFKQHTKVPIKVLPVGFDIDSIIEPKNIVEEKNTIFHIGAMNWMPNVEGINYFLDKIWPFIHEKNHNIKLYLAGRNMPDEFLQMKKDNVIVVGEVDDAKIFMKSKEIMIVPLLSGSGMRVKIIEAMTMGKVIVSTSIGVEGIDCENGKDILIADTPENFANAVLRVIDDAQLCETISNNARETVRLKYDIRRVFSKTLGLFI